MEELKITKANKKHLHHIKLVEKSSFDERSDRQISIKDRYSIVAKIGKKVVGYAISQMMWDKLHIFDIAVLPEYRSNGIGKTLLSNLISYAKSHKLPEVYLEARASNTSAIKLYKKISLRNKSNLQISLGIRYYI